MLPPRIAHRSGGSLKRSPLWMYALLCILLLSCILLISCSGFNTGTNSLQATKSVNITSAPQAQVALASLHWCKKPVMVFRDEGAVRNGTPTVGTATPNVSPTTTETATPGTSPTTTGTATVTATPKTITDWSQVEPYLGFTVYLPETLPEASCLISASGDIHDPTFGGIFTIGYLLPNHDSISFSEAPLLSQSTTFQCSPSTSSTKSGTPTSGPTVEPVQLCTGARDKTSVVLSARGTTDTLQKIFSALQPHVSWVPTS